MAIIDRDQVGLLAIRETGIAREVVRVLPDCEPGPGTGLNLRVGISYQDDSENPSSMSDDVLDDQDEL